MTSRISFSIVAVGWLTALVICSVQSAPVDNGGYQDHLQNLEYGTPYGSGYGNEPANYDFQYEVYGGGNFFGHQEARRDQKTNGKYHVLLPDGRRQTVTYVADETGYHPTVTYELVGNPVDASSSNDGYGYGAPVVDNSLTPQPNRYSSRIKRQFYSPEDHADVVQVYSSDSNPQQRFRVRRRRFTPKKGYLVVYPDLPSVTQSLKTED